MPSNATSCSSITCKLAVVVRDPASGRGGCRSRSIEVQEGPSHGTPPLPHVGSGWSTQPNRVKGGAFQFHHESAIRPDPDSGSDLRGCLGGPGYQRLPPTGSGRMTNWIFTLPDLPGLTSYWFYLPVPGELRTNL